MKLAFCEVLDDYTSRCRKIPKEEYLSNGKYIVIDQGQNNIAGYTNIDDGLFEDVPAIVFGDHTRIIKYVDEPFFLGADGVKLLKSKIKDANYKYLYYVLRNARIPDTGYNRHFKWLKEINLEYKDAESQKNIVKTLDTVTNIIELYKVELSKLDNLIRARFVEMFGDPIINSKRLETNILKDVFILKAGDFTAASDIAVEQSETNSYPCYGGNGIRGYVAEYNQEGEYSIVGRQGALSGNVQFASGKFKNTEHALLVIPIVEMNNTWINHLLLNLDLKRYQTGAAQPGLSVKNLQEIQIISVPIDKQNQFADFVHQVNKSKLLSVSQPQIHIYKTLTLL